MSLWRKMQEDLLNGALEVFTVVDPVYNTHLMGTVYVGYVRYFNEHMDRIVNGDVCCFGGGHATPEQAAICLQIRLEDYKVEGEF